MARIRHFKISFLIPFSLFILIVAGYLHTNTIMPKVKISKETSALNFNNNLLTLFSLGQKRVIADLLWISTLLESDNDHYKRKDLNSWIYQRFLSITLLDPNFLEAYQFGGQYLSIVKDDIVGAQDIFERGLTKFPEDYNLNYDAGFLFAFELGNFKRATQLYSKILHHHKAPLFLRSLIHKLEYAVHKDLSLTFTVLKKTYDNTKAGPIKDKLFIDLYAIKAEIDLKCLNELQSKCNEYDLEGKRYIKIKNKYFSERKFKKYKLNLKNKKRDL